MFLYFIWGREERTTCQGTLVEVGGQVAGPKNETRVVKLGRKYIYPLAVLPRLAL